MEHTIEPTGNPFWDFSLQFYGQKGVSDILLWFQDECRVDVNLMLYCCWAGLSRTQILTGRDMTFLRNLVDRWQSEIVQPLRSLRQELKTDVHGVLAAEAAGLRVTLEQAELEAERLQQNILYFSAPQETNGYPDEIGGRQNTISNLVLYLSQMRGQLDTFMMAQITALVDALFESQIENESEFPRHHK